jgi:hypothetical protein
MRRPLGLVALAAVIGLSPGPGAFAQSKPAPAAKAAPAAALPTGETLLVKHVAAAGGQAAYDRIKNRVVNAALEIGGANITLSLAIYAAKPDRLYTVADSEATGRIESGVADGIAWENSGMRGALVKSGTERDDALREAAFDSLIYWKEHLKGAECVGVTDIDGKPAYKVVVTPKVGQPQTVYFDRESAMVVQVETQVSAAGQVIDVVSKPGDYKPVDGVLVPFTVRQFVMGQERTVRIEKVQHNVELPADRFAPPPAIKALLEKK